MYCTWHKLFLVQWRFLLPMPLDRDRATAGTLLPSAFLPLGGIHEWVAGWVIQSNLPRWGWVRPPLFRGPKLPVATYENPFSWVLGCFWASLHALVLVLQVVLLVLFLLVFNLLHFKEKKVSSTSMIYVVLWNKLVVVVTRSSFKVVGTL